MGFNANERDMYRGGNYRTYLMKRQDQWPLLPPFQNLFLPGHAECFKLKLVSDFSAHPDARYRS